MITTEESAKMRVRGRSRRARRLRSRALDLIYPVALIGLGLLAWHLWVTLGDVPQYQWPSIEDTVHAAVHMGSLHRAAGTTATLVVVGFAIAVVVGIVLAVATATLRIFEVAVFPIIVSTQLVPLIALAPLFVVWWGFGITPRLIIVALFGYFPVFMTTLAGLRALEREKIYLGQSMGMSAGKMLWSIRLPSALPSIFAGLRLAITACVIGAVTAEFVIGSTGLGGMIVKSQANSDTPVLVAGLLLLATLGALTFGAVALAEHLAIPWQPSRRARHLAANM